ncbi:unnamed protein product [Arctogadus glacialis]
MMRPKLTQPILKALSDSPPPPPPPRPHPTPPPTRTLLGGAVSVPQPLDPYWKRHVPKGPKKVLQAHRHIYPFLAIDCNVDLIFIFHL